MNQETDLTSRGPQAPLPDGMEYCQITGAMTPTSDIVELHGYRVCAEGKSELLRRLKAGAILPGELEAPPFRLRFGAMVVDIFLVFLVFQAAGVALQKEIPIIPIEIHIQPDQFWFAMAIPMDGAIHSVFYLAAGLFFALAHGLYGKSPGKKIFGIMVVNEVGAPLGFRSAFIRSFSLAGPIAAVPLMKYFLWPQVYEKGVNYYYYMELLYLPLLIFVIADFLAAMLDRARQRSIHDRLSGTRVIAKR